MGKHGGMIMCLKSKEFFIDNVVSDALMIVNNESLSKTLWTGVWFACGFVAAT